MRRWLVLLTAALAASVSLGAQSPAPPLVFPTAAGTPLALADLKGKVVLVDVWASWCPPCKAAFPHYDALYTEYRARGFEVYAINVDERRADADRFLAGRTFTIPVVFDPKGVAPEQLRLRGMPTSYLVDRRGVIRFTHEGFTDKDVSLYARRIETLLAETP